MNEVKRSYFKKLKKLLGVSKMPTTKTLTIKEERNLKHAIKYIIDPEKTKNQTLTSGYKINAVNNAFFEMGLTRQIAENMIGKSNKKANEEVIARHIIQSFDPNDPLTPEEIHEIGRQTALDFLGGDYEFIIATHVDTDHLHNHIIFNTTSTVDLKKFRWQRGTTAHLRNISDKVADYQGATILQNKKRNSYTKYQQYRKKFAFRFELKDRLNFLLVHSTSWEDFTKKAKLLNITIDTNHSSQDYGQVTNYQLVDLPQKRPARDYTLNRQNRSYSQKNIIDRVEKNDEQAVYNYAEIAQKYMEYKLEKEKTSDVTFIIEPWQIEEDTMSGIYVEVEYGRFEKGVVKIPDYRLDQKKDGHYEAHFNYKDTFYFWGEDGVKKNKFIKGSALANYLSGKSGIVPIRKNSAIQNVREMITALNILSSRQSINPTKPKVLGQEFSDHVEEIQKAQMLLRDKLMSANAKLKFDPTNVEKLAKVKALREEKNEFDKELKVFEKQLKTYDAALNILNSKGNKELSEFEK